jgi:hypothetical protein
MLRLLLLGLLLSIWQVASAPDSVSARVPVNDPFGTVPAEVRDEVKASVDLIVKLHQERQWDKVYDLMGDKTKPRSEYVQEGYHPWTLIEFFPSGVQRRWDKNTDWIVNGCSVVSVNGKKERWESFIYINLKESHKRVRLLTALKKHGGPMPCVQPEATN